MADTIVDFPRGDNRGLGFYFLDGDGVPISLVGSRMLLTAVWPGGGLLTRDSDSDDDLALEFDAEITLPDGTTMIGDRLVWERTLPQSRSVPLGALTRFEFERRISGGQEFWGGGKFNGIGGLNPDV